MDSGLAWVNGKSGRQSWRYADAFQRSIISEAIYNFDTQSCMETGHSPILTEVVMPYGYKSENTENFENVVSET